MIYPIQEAHNGFVAPMDIRTHVRAATDILTTGYDSSTLTKALWKICKVVYSCPEGTVLNKLVQIMTQICLRQQTEHNQYCTNIVGFSWAMNSTGDTWPWCIDDNILRVKHDNAIKSMVPTDNKLAQFNIARVLRRLCKCHSVSGMVNGIIRSEIEFSVRKIKEVIADYVTACGTHGVSYIAASKELDVIRELWRTLGLCPHFHKDLLDLKRGIICSWTRTINDFLCTMPHSPLATLANNVKNRLLNY